MKAVLWETRSNAHRQAQSTEASRQHCALMQTPYSQNKNPVSTGEAGGPATQEAGPGPIEPVGAYSSPQQACGFSALTQQQHHQTSRSQNAAMALGL